MKKIELNPLALGLTVFAIAYGSYIFGGITGGVTPLDARFFKFTHKADFSSLNDVYGLMQRNFDGQIDDTKALNGAKAGLVAAGGDPYTAYLTADEAKSLNDSLTGKLSGIGAEIGLKNNIITVVAPIDDTPASRAGLKAGDIIARINDEDTTNMTVETAVSKIRGPKDTKVILKLIRQGTEEPFDITITRDDITVPSVKWSMKNGNIAYIDVSRFGPDTEKLVDQAASELKSQGATKVILDLRNDPGGYLDAAVGVSSQFLDTGKPVVEEKTGGKSINKLTARQGAKLRGLPTIVLINGGSASASEIVAGALRDNQAAKLVGEKSYGKGSVQEIKNLPDGAQLKVTIAHWFTPAGINIDKEGIKPDVEVKLTTDDYNASRDPQLDKALELLK